MFYGNYDKYPKKNVKGERAITGWTEISEVLNLEIEKGAKVLTVELYPETDREEILSGLKIKEAIYIDAETCALTDDEYRKLIDPFVTDDRVFGVMNTLKLSDVYVSEKIERLREKIKAASEPVILYGVGASLITRGDRLIYCDMARWEIQKRFAAGFPNWKTSNEKAPKLAKFKQGFFVEWRMADRLKRTLLDEIDFLIDTNRAGNPKMVSGEGFRRGLELFASEPFRLVPYFAPEVWGGQWMKEVCGLDKDAANYAWAFDGVPEENSLYMDFSGVTVEVPAVDVVFYRPEKLLGQRVHGRFGDEFPIRFDFLDTVGGQNLSLQVHPLTEYIQHTFGMHYTQDESYYILDCEEDSCVYLGLKEGVDYEKMISELEAADRGEKLFDADKYVNKWQAKKHDHFLIPAGTVHCSGSGTMVLEISATPYIFTFKLWDWGRLGLDGLPRPVHINHGKKVICRDRDTDYVKKNLINRFEVVRSGQGFEEERTGLHEREFIETRRLVVSEKTVLPGCGSVVMANVTDGEGAVIESTSGAFEPFEVHYAETFVIPDAAGEVTIRPISGCVTVVKAHVR